MEAAAAAVGAETVAAVAPASQDDQRLQAQSLCALSESACRSSFGRERGKAPCTWAEDGDLPATFSRAASPEIRPEPRQQAPPLPGAACAGEGLAGAAADVGVSPPGSPRASPRVQSVSGLLAAAAGPSSPGAAQLGGAAAKQLAMRIHALRAEAGSPVAGVLAEGAGVAGCSSPTRGLASPRATAALTPRAAAAAARAAAGEALGMGDADGATAVE